MLISRPALTVAFLGGDLFWVLLASKLAFRHSPLKPTISINKARQAALNYAEKMKWDEQKANAFIKKITDRSSWLFLSSFLLNVLTVSGVVVGANQVTKKGVKKDAALLTQSVLSQPDFSPLPYKKTLQNFIVRVEQRQHMKP